MKIAKHTARLELLLAPALKKSAEKKALKKKMSVAEYIRELIEKDIAIGSFK